MSAVKHHSPSHRAAHKQKEENLKAVASHQEKHGNSTSDHHNFAHKKHTIATDIKHNEHTENYTAMRKSTSKLVGNKRHSRLALPLSNVSVLGDVKRMGLSQNGYGYIRDMNLCHNE